MTKLLSGASATAVAISLYSTALLAQTSLPTIDIGKPKPVTHAAAKPKPSPHTGVGHVAQGGRGNSRPVRGEGTGGAGGAGGGAGQGGGAGGGAGTGTGAGGYGGAGAAQDPYNKSYVLQNASTGTKTNTPVMDTPLNVQTVTQKVLQDQQAITLSQALQNVSGVTVTDGTNTVTGYGSSGIFVRGFLEQTYYRDGFRVDSSYFGNGLGNNAVQLANVASVEVLKGPGAILYGLVEPGGIINLTTKEPLDAPYYAVQQQIGSLADYRTTIDATGPLNADKSLLYRINMSYENNGAPFNSFIDLTHSQSLFLAPVVKWNIDGATWVKLESQYNHYSSDIYFPFDPLLDGVPANVPRSTNYGPSSPYLQTELFAALTWSHQFDKDWSIKQQIAYDYTDINEENAFPFSIVSTPPAVTGGTILGAFAQTTYSTNVDITGHINTFGAEHTLLLGGDAYWMAGSASYSFIGFTTNSLTNPFQLGLPVPQCDPAAFLACSPSGTLFTQDTAGLYLQDQIKLPYNFFLLAGARYQYIRQTNANGESLQDLGPPGGTVSPTLTGQALTPRFGLLWRPQEWVSLYGNYTEGYGPNQGFIFPGELTPPTSAKSWEAGAKLEFFNGKLRVTGGYYELVKTNIPVPDTNPAHNCGLGGLGSCSIIIGEGRSTGPELDIQGEILPGWNVIANYTNDDVRATKSPLNPYPALGGSLPAAGQRFPGVPRNQANLWSTYEFQSDSVLKGWKVGAGYHYMGSRPVTDTANYVPYVWPLIPSYGTVDLMAAYSFSYAGSKMTAQLNITNLLDRTYYGSEFNALTLAGGPQGGFYRSYGAPFAVMGSLRAELDKGATPSPYFLPVPSPASASLSPYNWTGLYVGGQMGYGFGDNDGSVGWATAQGQANQNELGSGAQGVIGGVHLGYNQQFDQWVLGLEGSVDGTTLNKNALVLAPNLIADPMQFSGIGGTVNSNVQSGIQGSVRARAGYAFGRLLPYATGGVAFGSFRTDAQLFGTDLDGVTTFAASGANSAFRVGWTLGAGVEYAINNRWSALAEYRYSDFGHLAIAADPSAVGAVFAVDRHLDQQQVQVGFSYKLFADPEPVAVPMIVKGPALADNSVSKPAGATPAVPPPPFVPNWTGFYLGAQIGYGWGLNDGSLTYATPGGLAGQSNLGSSAIISGGGSSRNGDAIGVIGGVHLGYNKQFDKWVVGLEGSLDPTLMGRAPFINVPDTAAANATGAPGIGVSATGAIWSRIQGSVRARAGYAYDRMLFYGTGGLALGEFGSNFQLYGIDNTTFAPFYAADQRSATRLGWTVGGGVEYAVNPHWVVRGEYRYTDFGHLGDVPAPTSMGVFYTADRHLDQQQVQVGVSYHFNGGAMAAVETKAIAADLPSMKAPLTVSPSSPPQWTGFYAGLNAGGVFDVNARSHSLAGDLFDDVNPAAAGAAAAASASGKAEGTWANLIGGGQIGYNHRLSDIFVAGLEADIQGVPGSSGAVASSAGAADPLGTPTTMTTSGRIQHSLAYLGTVRGRVGVLVFPSLLVYGGAGLAYGGVNLSTAYSTADLANVYGPGSGYASYSAARAGWTGAGGLEWMFAPRWSAKLEYVFFDLGTATTNTVIAGLNNTTGTTGYAYATSTSLRFSSNLVRAGLNYHFNWADNALPVVATY